MVFSRLHLSRASLVLLSMLAFTSMLYSNPPAKRQEPAQTVVKANTRLVVVDVVATDNKGTPAPDLTRDDFTLLEDGRPQRVSIFNFQHPEKVSVTNAAPLPPNVFTNVPATKPTSLNVILLDALNGDFSSRAYGREQLIKYFESKAVLQPTALYALEDNLKLLHGFTTDNKELAEVLRNFKIHATNHLSTVEATASPFTQRGDFQTAPVHIENTLIALNLLAQSLTAYPGRKNLIWISEAFPLDLFPDMSASGQLNTIKMMKNPSGAGGFPVDNAGAMADVNSQSAATPRKSDTADYTAEVQKVADALMTAPVKPSEIQKFDVKNVRYV